MQRMLMRAFLKVSLKACFVSLSCFLEWAHSDKRKNCHQKQFWENQWRMSEPQRGGTGVASNTWNCHTHPALPPSILPLFETERSLCNARPLLLWAFLLPAAELLSDVLISYFGATFSPTKTQPGKLHPENRSPNSSMNWPSPGTTGTARTCAFMNHFTPNALMQYSI